MVVEVAAEASQQILVEQLVSFVHGIYKTIPPNEYLHSIVYKILILYTKFGGIQRVKVCNYLFKPIKH